MSYPTLNSKELSTILFRRHSTHQLPGALAAPTPGWARGRTPLSAPHSSERADHPTMLHADTVLTLNDSSSFSVKLAD